MTFIGIDGTPGGWITVAEDNHSLVPAWIPEEGITGFLDKIIGNKQVQVGIDIPIGLPDASCPLNRACDVTARSLLQWKSSSIFAPPCREALHALKEGYPAASRANQEVMGKKLSKQSFFIAGKMKTIDDWIQPAYQQQVHEIHPELAFTQLNGGVPLLFKKNQGNGICQRLLILQAHFPNLTAEWFATHQQNLGASKTDDLLDALVCLLTLKLKRKTLPYGLHEQGNEYLTADSRGLEATITFPVTVL